jgi:eukaryotic-like serine/threonine-protein kinase
VETPAETTYRFGPFEVNAASGELLKQGKRVRLQEQPFRLLVILLENAGEVVTRAEIQRRIWEANTFVDFDSGLRVAVRKLRDALGDDAENPRYIETIPKRGYRLIGPAARPADSIPQTNGNQTKPAAVEMVGFAKPTKWMLVGGALLLAASIAAFLPRHRKPNALTGKDMVVLADFENSTGDPVFDGTLRQGMAVELEQSPFLSLASEERIRRTLRMMGQPPNARLTREIAREVCQRTAGAVVLEGSIGNLGSEYVLGLRARNCRSGEILADEQAQAARKEDVLNALSRMASKLRARLGESLATVEEHNTPLAEATTPSLEALKAYSLGWKVSASEGEAAAVPFFKRAVEIDPKFAVASAALGLMYGAMGESGLSQESTSKAYELRDRASDREKFFIAASYDGRVTGNLEKAQLTCEAFARVYPLDTTPHAYLAGFIYPASGKYAESIAEAQKLVALEPDFAAAYLILGYSYVNSGQSAEGESTVQRATARNLEHPEFLGLRYDIAFLKNDKAGMQQQVDSARGKSGAEDLISDHEAFSLAYYGRMQEARKMSQHAAELARQAANQERAALWEAGEALREGFVGNRTAASSSAFAILKLAKDREAEYGAAFALALAGDSSRPQILAGDLERRFPEDTAVRFSYLPTLRAQLALNHHDPAKALELLEVAAPYELGVPRSSIHGLFGALYPVYVRGEAYLAEQQGAEAAREFQKILDHRGIVLSDAIGALAHLQLGRAFALSGDKAKAKIAYQDFLSLWNDADPDIPILAQAKTEYRRLQ